MSSESMQWLNQNCLIGFTEKRGTAWHYRASDQGLEPNHYPGAIPEADVIRRLFDWTPDEKPLYIPRTIVGGPDDGAIAYVEVPDRKAITRSDNGHVMGIFKSGYRPHRAPEWCMDNVSALLDSEISIASAILLRKGARACVTVERPDNVSTPEGLDIRPALMAFTSFDGSLATGYKFVVQIPVCDNTFELALGESGSVYKVRHSKYSTLKIQDAKDALGIVHEGGDRFSEALAEWCNTSVSPAQFDAVLETMIPTPDEDGPGKTRAENRQSDIRGLYNGDPRCTPWNGTKFGVLQTFNTWLHHSATQKGDVARVERNTDNTLSGKIAEFDATVLNAVDAVLA